MKRPIIRQEEGNIRRFTYLSVYILCFSAMILYVVISEPNQGSFVLREDFTDEDAIEIKRMDRLMAIRREYLKDQCRRLELDKVGELDPYEYLINERYKLVWCHIFKAASSSWLYNFNRMAGFTVEECNKTVNPHGLARERYPRPSIDELNEIGDDYISMLIVRHPFERLSSAYCNKIEKAPVNGMYYNIGLEIIKKYRKFDQARKHKPFNVPTFQELVTFILEEAKANNTLDIHWVPYTKFCTPCHFDYDVILKCESLKEEQSYLIKKAGIEHIAEPQWRNKRTETPEANTKTEESLRSHFSQLSRDEFDQLYELYKYDFLLFGYSAEKYLGYLKTDEIK